MLSRHDVLQGAVCTVQSIHEQTPLHAVIYAKVPPLVKGSLDRTGVQCVSRSLTEDFALIDCRQARLLDVGSVNGNALPFAMSGDRYRDGFCRTF